MNPVNLVKLVNLVNPSEVNLVNPVQENYTLFFYQQSTGLGGPVTGQDWNSVRR